MSSARTTPSPEALLRALVAKLSAEDAKLFRALRAAVRKRVPTANEFVYDYGTSLVTSYSPTEHGKDGVLSIAVKADGVRLYFGGGPRLPDPKKLLQGSGGARFIMVESARQLAHPDVKALIAAAIKEAAVPLASKGKGKVVDRSVTQKKRRAGRSSSK